MSAIAPVLEVITLMGEMRAYEGSMDLTALKSLRVKEMH